MKFTINNLAMTSAGSMVSLTVEETATPNRFVLVDAHKACFPLGIAYLDVSDDIKKGVERTLLRMSVPYTDANGDQQAETFHVVRTGNSLALVGAPQATWTAGAISNNAAGALFGAQQVLASLLFGVASDNIPMTVGAMWADSEDGTGLTASNVNTRMNNVFVRAAAGLTPVEEGATYNGAYDEQGYARPVANT